MTGEPRARRFLIDRTDPRFRIAGNEDVLDFIRRANPFAHDGVGTILFELGDRLPGAHAYCPLPSSYAYVVLHTTESRIFAIAFGMRTIAFRVAAPADAPADGGMPAPEIGPSWVSVDPWDRGARTEARERLTRWGERALRDVNEAAS